jgi:hypothetical protein
MNKTFEELGYKAGDTVRCVGSNPYFHVYKTGDIFTLELNDYGNVGIGLSNGTLGDWELMAPIDLTWGDMTPEQQGALLLAHHQGKTIEVKAQVPDRWIKVKQPMFTKSSYYYRTEPEPVVVHHKRYAGLCKGDLGAIWKGQYSDAAYELTYDTEDGVPVCSSVKLSKLT